MNDIRLRRPPPARSSPRRGEKRIDRDAEAQRVELESLCLGGDAARLMPGDGHPVEPDEGGQTGLGEAALAAQKTEVRGKVSAHAPHCGSVATTRQEAIVSGGTLMPCDEIATVQRMPLDPLDVGHRIAAARNSLGWNQEKLAEESGVDRSLLAKYETGKRMPMPDNLLRLAQALGTTTDSLLGADAGIQVAADLVAAFRESPWAQTLHPPATEKELATIEKLGPGLWSVAPATAEAVYHMILAFRAAPR